MAGNEDIILAKYVLDRSDFLKGLDEIDQGLESQSKLIDQTGKQVTSVGNKYAAAGQQMAKATIDTSQGFKALTDKVKATGQAIEKSFRPGSIAALKKELAETRKQMDNVKAGGIVFKGLTDKANELEKAIKAVADRAPSLKQQYQAALKDVQNGVEGAAERAGELKDRLDDANESVRNLATGSSLEAFNNQLGATVSKIAALDFQGAAESAQQLQAISSKITFKEATKGIGQLSTSLANTGAALLTNPVFLLAGAITAITYAVYKLVTAEDEEIANINKARKAQEERFNLTIEGYDSEIRLAKAAGKVTVDMERSKLKVTIENQKKQLQFDEAEIKRNKERLEDAKELLKASGQGGILDEQIKTIDKNSKKLIDARKRAIDKAEKDLQVFEIETTKERLSAVFDDEEAGYNERIKALNEFYTGTARTTKEYNDKLKSIAADEDNRVEDELQERQKNYQDYLDRKTKQDEQYRQNKLEEDQFAIQQEQEMLAAATKKREEDLASENDRLKAADEQFRAENQEQQSVIDEDELARQEEIRKNRLSAELDFQKGILDINAATANAIAEGFLAVYSSIGVNEEGIFVIQKAAAIAKLIIDQQKAMAAYSIAQAEATALAANPVTAAAGATALALITAQKNLTRINFGIGIATIAGQTIGKFAAQPAKKLAKGTPFVDLDGNPSGIDTIPAWLNKGERVITDKDNLKYWDDLEAMRKGKYDSYVRNNYVLPELREFQRQVEINQEEVFASNIAKGLMLNGGWKGENINKTLNAIDRNNGKRHNELIGSMKMRPPRLRKQK